MQKRIATKGNLTRPKLLMPDFVKLALEKHGLVTEYEARPAYQRNDYIGWIVNAKRQETKQKRLCQMLEEIKQGGVYMNMRHTPSGK